MSPLVLAEPAMTNAGFLLPRPRLPRLAATADPRDSGTLLALDETHSLITSYGGLCGRWDLEPDFLTVGKSIAAGVPLAAYGMSDEIGALIAPPTSHLVSGALRRRGRDGRHAVRERALDGRGARGADRGADPGGVRRTAALGERMAAGLRGAIAAAGLRWNVAQLGTHAYYGFTPSRRPTGGVARQ